MSHHFAGLYRVLVVLALAWAFALPAQITKKKPAVAEASEAVPAQRIDEEYTKLIKQYLQDPRVTTELVDHMPASDAVPSPLKFFGRIPGTPGELTYAKDINRYFEALAKTSPRAMFWKIGQTEEGRDQVVLAIADDATIKQLNKYKATLASLSDPRKTHQQARESPTLFPGCSSPTSTQELITASPPKFLNHPIPNVVDTPSPKTHLRTHLALSLLVIPVLTLAQVKHLPRIGQLVEAPILKYSRQQPPP